MLAFVFQKEKACYRAIYPFVALYRGRAPFPDCHDLIILFT